MRIVAGKYKGRHFDVPRSFKARPTTDFAKENLFNVLRSYFDFEAEAPRALDLFAGTGSITLELLSRGCSSVTAVELDGQHCSFIRQFVKVLKAEEQVTLIKADVLRFLTRSTETYDFIFADPPYALPELELLPDLIFSLEATRKIPISSVRIAPQVESHPVPTSTSKLAPGGLFILEHGRAQDFSRHPHFVEHREYGSVNFSFFQ